MIEDITLLINDPKIKTPKRIFYIDTGVSHNENDVKNIIKKFKERLTHV